jgi:hypothetical protein
MEIMLLKMRLKSPTSDLFLQKSLWPFSRN